VYIDAERGHKRTCESQDVALELEKVSGFRDDDITALECFQRGSKEAFEAVARRYMKDAYFIALSLVGNREDALDLSQEAFIRAYRNMRRFNPKWGFFPWFYQILKNLCFNHLRKRRAEQDNRLEDFRGRAPTTDVDDRFAPEVVAERNETKDRVWRAIGKLDEKHREVIILRHFQHLSYEQIARNVFCNKGTVMSRLYYAHKKLKEILDSEKGGQQE
jgi:RNA polymerase sigma-70 factor (ECF subfamily)